MTLTSDVRETSTTPTAAVRCIRTAVDVGDPSLRIGGRLRRPADPVAIDALPLFDRQLARPNLRQWVRAAAAALVVAAVFTALWYAVRGWGDLVAAVVAVTTGLALGGLVVAASGWRHGWQLSALAVAATIVAMVCSANFVQRDQLQTGIETLEPRWAAMRSLADAAATDQDAEPNAGSSGAAVDPSTDSAIGGGTGGGMIPDDAVLAENTVVGGILVPAGSVIPPPEIVAVMPTEAFALMGPEVMAVVWPDIPDARKSEFAPALVAEVEALIAAAESTGAASSDQAEGSPETSTGEGLTLDEARAIYAESSYDIPEPVLACAPPPDLTQPDAAAGLGFPDGVPVFLPLSDYYRSRDRGDGLDVGAPTPWCFAAENARAEPVEAASWLIALALAALIPARRRLALVDGDRRRRTRYEHVTGGS